MNSRFIRTLLLLLHVIASFWLINYLIGFDITSRWVWFIGFLLLMLLLLFLFIQHLVNYIYFIKTYSK